MSHANFDRRRRDRRPYLGRVDGTPRAIPGGDRSAPGGCRTRLRPGAVAPWESGLPRPRRSRDLRRGQRADAVLRGQGRQWRTSHPVTAAPTASPALDISASFPVPICSECFVAPSTVSRCVTGSASTPSPRPRTTSTSVSTTEPARAFDLVVGTDGIHSRVRELLLGRIATRDTGWGCYVWWGDPQLADIGETTERWGAGSFLGTYPCRDHLCVIAGAPISTLRPDRPEGRADRLSALFGSYGTPITDLLGALPRDDEPLYLWPMSDVRSPRWVQGRVALVGDAAAAFLPTAGIGASMALESAAVLADELSRTDPTYLPNALQLYERRRRTRVEAAQTQSRRLARLMFLNSPRLASLRNRGLRFASMEQMVRPLIKDLREPI